MNVAPDKEWTERIAAYNREHGPWNGQQEPSDRARLLGLARPLTYYDNFDKVVRLDWLVKGMLAKEHTSYVFGPPGSGKSSLFGSAAVHLGFGLDWHGFKVRKPYASVYFAMERASLVEKRIWAECQRDGLGAAPVAVAPGIVNLMDAMCVDAIIGTILTAEDKLGMEVGLAIFDTFAKGIAAGGGDENTAKDQNRAWGNLRHVHERLARYHTIHLGAVGHTGKDESRGPRGSNAADGDNDVSIQISNGVSVKEASVYKANELPDGPLMQFRMEAFDTGLKDEDGEAIEVWITDSEVIEARHPVASGPKLTKNQQTMYSILRDAGQGGLTADQWNEKLRDVGIGTKRKADIYDARASLKAKALVREFCGRWTAAT